MKANKRYRVTKRSKIHTKPLAEANVVQEWISVKDPPKENGYYMCWLAACSVGEKKKCEHRKLYWEDNLWLSCAKSFRIEYPLYWMPLPQPPKGE